LPELPLDSKAVTPFEVDMRRVFTVTAKGQVTLRKEVLEHLGVAPGDKIVVDFLPSGRAEVRAATGAASIKGFIGCLEQAGVRPLSIDEINDGGKAS
jgi:bifunctional DNA-binding transcriptional regulator/antitoxin component of YhaV-PrlF toxin-antitoxin module